LENNINSKNFLEVLIAGVKLTPRVKYVSKCKGNRRVKDIEHDIKRVDLVVGPEVSLLYIKR